MGKALKFDATPDELRTCLLVSDRGIDHVQAFRNQYRNKLGSGMVDAYAFLNCLLLDEGTCGNSRLDVGEACDTNNLGAWNGRGCVDFGYDLGDIGCQRDCRGFDFGQCFSIFLDQPRLSGPLNSEQRFIVEIPNDWEGMTEVRFELSYTGLALGYADADLFVRRDGPPDFTTYDCLSVETGSEELCTFTQPGTYHILVWGHGTYSNVNLLVTANGKPQEAKCGNGFLEGTEFCDGNNFKSVLCEDLGFQTGDMGCQSDCSVLDVRNCYDTLFNLRRNLNRGSFFRFQVDATEFAVFDRLEITTSSTRSSADVDLYVSKDTQPTLDVLYRTGCVPSLGPCLFKFQFGHHESSSLWETRTGDNPHGISHCFGRTIHQCGTQSFRAVSSRLQYLLRSQLSAKGLQWVYRL